VMLAVLILGAAWWTVTAISNPINRVADERSHNARVLAQAKQALLGWVSQNAADASEVNPGKLPCPEALGNFVVPPSANEGVMQGFCAGAATAVGRLPWRSLGLDKPYDASGEVLWYVVSPGWKRPNSTVPEPILGLNSNSIGQLAVDGQPNAVVAAIIAPGRRLQITPNANQIAQGCATQSQARTTFPPTDSLDYLDCQNITGASLRTVVVDNVTNEVFNDQIVTITAAEVMAAIEGVVAKRIEQTVAPQLAAAYNTAPSTCASGVPAVQTNVWGVSCSCPSGTATTPVFPFAAPFGDPAASDFKGAVGTPEGLLPLSAQTCNALTAGRCDSNFGTALAFVQWNVGTLSVTQTGGTATSFSADCSASTVSEIRCTITYSQTLCLLSCAINATIQVQGDGPNVGRTLKTLVASAAAVAPTAPSTASGFALTAPLSADANASARAIYTGTLEGGSAGICGSLLAIVCSGSATVTIPITVFQDHPLVNPTTSDAWYWFISNNWHHVTYYALSPDHTPNGARDCAASVNCLTVNVQGAVPWTNRRAVLALAGRSLLGTIGTNRALGDFLDTIENTDADWTFEQNRVNKRFNDRFVSLSP
jgi:hypothetical protein